MTTPEIAIVAPNTLTSLGLQNLLEEIIPMATIRVFRSFAELMDDTPDMYAHYFIASQIYFEHTAFFLPRKPKTIVLAGGDNQPQLSGVPTLNIYQDEKSLIKDILRLHRYGHQQGHVAANTPDNHDLSAREIEVLVLDYQRAHQQRDCRQTEHQSDHRHHPPQEYRGETGHQVCIGTDHLCCDAWICRRRQNMKPVDSDEMISEN